MRFFFKTFSILAFLITITGCESYSPMPEAFQALEGNDRVQVQDSAEAIHFQPLEPSDRGFIFYPGANVDPVSYSPMALELAEQGIVSVIAKFPLDIAFAAPNRADSIRASLPSVNIWAIGGHSLGGVVAGQYFLKQLTGDALDGLVLVAAYPDKSTNLSETGVNVLSVYATEDQLTTLSAISETQYLLPADTEYVEIVGGNHAQFGWYGEQSGDGVALIGREEQQAILVDQIAQFIQAL